MINKKQRILNFLKKEKKAQPTSKIAVKIGSNMWMAEKYLEAMEEEGSVIKEIKNIGTYWELKKK